MLLCSIIYSKLLIMHLETTKATHLKFLICMFLIRVLYAYLRKPPVNCFMLNRIPLGRSYNTLLHFKFYFKCKSKLASMILSFGILLQFAKNKIYIYGNCEIYNITKNEKEKCRLYCCSEDRHFMISTMLLSIIFK